MTGSQHTDKSFRKSTPERVQFETSVQYVPADESLFSGHCGDLSVGGIFLKTDYPFDPDETIKVSFSLPDQKGKNPISCRARVAWTNFQANRRKPSYPSGVGLQFLDLPKKDLSALSSFIDSYDDNKKMNVLCAWCGSSLGLRKGPVGVTSHGICSHCREKLNL